MELQTGVSSGRLICGMPTVGTELNIVQEGLPDMIPPEACYLGWQESLRNLAMLVEPEINQ